MSGRIANNIGALQKVSDFRTLKTDDGELMLSGDETYVTYRANAAITKGQVVMLVAATSTAALSVTPMTTAADPRLMVGFAVTAQPTAGNPVRICTKGHCELYVNAQTVAFGDVALVPGTNAGEASCSATDPTATTIAGTILGTVLYAKDATTNRAPFRLDPR